MPKKIKIHEAGRHQGGNTYSEEYSPENVAKNQQLQSETVIDATDMLPQWQVNNASIETAHSVRSSSPETTGGVKGRSFRKEPAIKVHPID
jgi:hypothetical protein